MSGNLTGNDMERGSLDEIQSIAPPACTRGHTSTQAPVNAAMYSSPKAISAMIACAATIPFGSGLSFR